MQRLEAERFHSHWGSLIASWLCHGKSETNMDNHMDDFGVPTHIKTFIHV